MPDLTATAARVRQLAREHELRSAAPTMDPATTLELVQCTVELAVATDDMVASAGPNPFGDPLFVSAFGEAAQRLGMLLWSSMLMQAISAGTPDPNVRVLKAGTGVNNLQELLQLVIAARGAA